MQSEKNGRPWRENPRTPLYLALAGWIVPMLVISVMVAVNPSHRSVTPTYHKAVENWLGHKSLYAGFDYHYLPHFALLFAPFHLLPLRVGDVLWRLVCAVLLVSGLWRVCRSFPEEGASRRFLWATLLCLPISLPALRNGQANALLAGLFAHATASLVQKEWWRAVLCLVVALAAKQFGIVFLLLAPVIYAPLRWRLAAGLLALAIAPFLFANPAYVLEQHREAITHLRACATVTQHRFADVSGIVRTFGAELPVAASQVIRLVAAGATLMAWWMFALRLEAPLRAMWLYALATSYLMLFNPMTEANSYVILAPALGCWAAWALSWPQMRAAGWVIGGIALSMGLLPNLVRPFFGNQFALFWHPAMTILFLAILSRWILRPNLIEKARVQPAQSVRPPV